MNRSRGRPIWCFEIHADMSRILQARQRLVDAAKIRQVVRRLSLWRVVVVVAERRWSCVEVSRFRRGKAATKNSYGCSCIFEYLRCPIGQTSTSFNLGSSSVQKLELGRRYTSRRGWQAAAQSEQWGLVAVLM
jgi:hypothetical protein